MLFWVQSPWNFAPRMRTWSSAWDAFGDASSSGAPKVINNRGFHGKFWFNGIWMGIFLGNSSTRKPASCITGWGVWSRMGDVMAVHLTGSALQRQNYWDAIWKCIWNRSKCHGFIWNWNTWRAIAWRIIMIIPGLGYFYNLVSSPPFVELETIHEWF